MTTTKLWLFLILGSVPIQPALTVAEQRIWLEAKINDKPVRLAFDSGSSWPVLTTRAVQKLGLRVVAAPTNNVGHDVLAGVTEEVDLDLEGTKAKMSFLIISLPPYAAADFEGLLGWSSLSRDVLRIDAGASQIEFLAKAPTSTAAWTCLSVFTNSDMLDLQIPHGGVTNGVLCIDTGSPDGFALPPQEWHRWKKAHPNSTITLETGFSPLDGFFVYEETWADQISIGPIILTGVPIVQSGPGNADRIGGQYEGTLGLAALKRLEFIVDGKNGLAFIRPKHTRPSAYEHNRLGAVFVPAGIHTNQAVAQVVENGPAYEAGVRNGDILLQVDQVKVTTWNSGWLNRFHKPAGTRLKLTLERGKTNFVTIAILREIVKPSR